MLQPLKTCDFLTSNQPYETENIYSFNIQTGKKLCEILKNSGWSFAFNVSANLFGIGLLHLKEVTKIEVRRQLSNIIKRCGHNRNMRLNQLEIFVVKVRNNQIGMELGV